MSDSDEEGFHQEAPQTFTIRLRQHPTSRVLKNKSINTFLYRSPISLHAELQLYDYPRMLDHIGQPNVDITAPSNMECLHLVQKQEGAAMQIGDFFPRKQLCVYNRFHENLMIKRDTTIVIRNIAKRIRNDQLTTFHERIPTNFTHHGLLFSSDFEGGNLHCVFKDRRSGVYYLFLQNDVNTHGYNIWFHFNVKAFQAGKHSFVIINLVRPVRFDNEIALLTCSSLTKKYERNVGFKCVESRFKHCDNDKNYWSLLFQYEFREAEQVYISLLPPYTYSKLLRMIRQIEQPLHPNIMIYTQIAGKSELGNFVPCVRITKRQKSSKKAIFITARQHPCETVGSFVCQEILRLLSQESPLTISLLERFNFYIIPMINPDGVIHGNSRTNLMGYDLNRSWGKPFPYISSQCQQIWSYLESIVGKENGVAWTFDLHGHSRQLGYFAYFSEQNECSMILNHLLKSKSNFFEGDKCLYSVGSSKKQSIRGQFHQKMHVENAVTIQTSFYGYKDSNGKFCHFDTIHYHLIAKNLLESLIETQEMMENKVAKHQVIQQISKQIRVGRNAPQIDENDLDSDSNPEEDYLHVDERDQEELKPNYRKSGYGRKLKTEPSSFLRRSNQGNNSNLKIEEEKSNRSIINDFTANSFYKTNRSEKERQINLTFYAGRKNFSPKDSKMLNQKCQLKNRRKVYSEIKTLSDHRVELMKSNREDQQQFNKKSIQLKNSLRVTQNRLKYEQGRTMVGGFRAINDKSVCELQTIVYPTSANLAYDLRKSLREKRDKTKQLREKEFGNTNIVRRLIESERARERPKKMKHQISTEVI